MGASERAPARAGARLRGGDGRAAARGSPFVILGGRAPSCLPLKSKGGAAVAELRGGENMVRRLLITVRIRRADGPPRVRAFVVHIARPAGEWAAPSVRAAAALVLMLLRSQRRAQRPHPRPGRKGLENPGAQSALE